MKIMTSISVSGEVWRKINMLRQPGETMNSVIEKLLSKTDKDTSDVGELLSDEDFDDLLNNLLVSEEDLKKYLEITRKSFARKHNED